VVDAYFESPWLPVAGKRALPAVPLPVALAMAGLYEPMLRRLMPLPARTGETLKDHVERLTQLRGKQNEYVKLEARLRQEKQFNRKVEKNSQLRSQKTEIELLT